MANVVVRFLAVLGTCLLLSPVRAADEDTVKTIVRKMRDREECTVQLQIKKTGETSVLTPFNIDSAPWVLERAFAEKGEGDFVATVRFKKDGQSFTLVSKGLTEDLFAVRYLKLEERFPKWYGRALAEIKSSADVQPGPPFDDPIRLGRVAEPTKPITEALGYAKAKYDEKRPELMKRFHNDGGKDAYRNNLWYAPSHALKWEIHMYEKALYVSTRTCRLGASATFLIEFQETKDGTWRYVRLLARDTFHGE